MIYRLRQLYLIWLLPAVILAAGVEAARVLGMIPDRYFTAPEWVARVGFILAAMTALAGPVFIRAVFAHVQRAGDGVAETVFFRFQAVLMSLALVTPYLACAALLFGFPRFYGGAIVLMALYAVYYYYPSERRINFDRRIFRVR